MIADLGFVVDLFANKLVLVERFNSPVIGADGVALARTLASSQLIMMSAQPWNDDKLDRNKEHFNTGSVVALFSKTEIRTRDRCTFDGRRYEIETVEPWNTHGAFWQGVARELDGQET